MVKYFQKSKIVDRRRKAGVIGLSAKANNESAGEVFVIEPSKAADYNIWKAKRIKQLAEKRFQSEKLKTKYVLRYERFGQKGI